MSRRWPDMRLTYNHWSTGDAIAAGVAMIAGIVGILMAIFLLGQLVKPAHARDAGQWDDSNPLIQSWYKSLMQPDNPHMSCCGEADAYWADKVEFKDGKIIAVITDTRPDEPLGRKHVPPGTRVVVPPHKLTWRYGNPVGHQIIFLGPDLGVYCFVQGSGV